MTGSREAIFGALRERRLEGCLMVKQRVSLVKKTKKGWKHPQWSPLNKGCLDAWCVVVAGQDRGRMMKSRVTKWQPKKASPAAEKGNHLVNRNC